MRVLCYGDSNTWGFSPASGLRYGEDTRWPGALRRCLGEGYQIIEDGLNGRSLCAFAPPGDPLNGAQHLPSLIRAHKAVDLVILFLGVNDLFLDPAISAQDMLQELSILLEAVRRLDPSTKILLLSPLAPKVGAQEQGLVPRQIQVAVELSALLERELRRRGQAYLDPSTVISASPRDGVHIEAEDHLKLGLHLCAQVRGILDSEGEER